MKKIMTLVLCLSVLGALLAGLARPAAAAGSAHMSLRSSAGTLYRGDSFTLTVSLSNDQPVSNGGVILSFDSSVFEFLGGKCHVGNATLAEVSASRNGGVFVLQTDSVVSGTIFTINMRVRDSAAFGSHSISGSASLSIPCSFSGTGVTVACRHSWGGCAGVDGNSHQYTCAVCGQQKTEAHTWDGGKVAKAATCKDPGVKTLTCTGCGMTKDETIPVTGDHKYGAWSSNGGTGHSHTCTVCGKKETAAHTWNSGKVTKAATCKETGVRHLTCTGCGAEKDETIPVSNQHKYGAWSSTGDAGHTRTCAVCGKKDTASHTWNEGTVLEKANCLVTGLCRLTCTGCGETKTETLPKTGHAYGESVYVDAGSHRHTCADCGVEAVEPHAYGGWSHDGSWHFRTCEGCGNKAEQAVHVPGPKATEETDQICTVCSRILQPRGAHVHSFGEEWTTDELGHWHACADCNEKSGAAPHEFDDPCDAQCNICGMDRQPAHAPADAWSADEGGHWYACADCGGKVAFDPHTAGPAATITSAQNCTVCGYEMAPVVPHDHIFDSDGSRHSHFCACGEAYEAEAADCRVCAGFPWGVVCILETAAVCAAGAVLWLKKRGLLKLPVKK